jgi:RNA polymerase sigma-70 factor, ECF subfamily
MADGQLMDVARLVVEHHQAIYRYAYRLTGSVHDAEDLSQQTFMVAQRKLPQLREANTARSWLFSILRNSFLRDRSRRRPVPAGNLQLNLDSIPAEVPVIEKIDDRRLQEALNQLPEAFRIVVLMFYFENCSYIEIAQELDLPVGTVMSRLARAKRHLRTRLVGAGLGESTKKS